MSLRKMDSVLSTATVDSVDTPTMLSPKTNEASFRFNSPRRFHSPVGKRATTAVEAAIHMKRGATQQPQTLSRSGSNHSAAFSEDHAAVRFAKRDSQRSTRSARSDVGGGDGNTTSGSADENKVPTALERGIGRLRMKVQELHVRRMSQGSLRKPPKIRLQTLSSEEMDRCKRVFEHTPAYENPVDHLAALLRQLHLAKIPTLDVLGDLLTSTGHVSSEGEALPFDNFIQVVQMLKRTFTYEQKHYNEVEEAFESLADGLPTDSLESTLDGSVQFPASSKGPKHISVSALQSIPEAFGLNFDINEFLKGVQKNFNGDVTTDEFRFCAGEEDPKIVNLFTSLGGEADLSGVARADMLIQNSIRINIPPSQIAAFIANVDADNVQGGLTYNQFFTMVMQRRSEMNRRRTLGFSMAGKSFGKGSAFLNVLERGMMSRRETAAGPKVSDASRKSVAIARSTNSNNNGNSVGPGASQHHRNQQHNASLMDGSRRGLDASTLEHLVEMEEEVQEAAERSRRGGDPQHILAEIKRCEDEVMSARCQYNRVLHDTREEMLKQQRRQKWQSVEAPKTQLRITPRLLVLPPHRVQSLLELTASHAGKDIGAGGVGSGSPRHPTRPASTKRPATTPHTARVPHTPHAPKTVPNSARGRPSTTQATASKERLGASAENVTNVLSLGSADSASLDISPIGSPMNADASQNARSSPHPPPSESESEDCDKRQGKKRTPKRAPQRKKKAPTTVNPHAAKAELSVDETPAADAEALVEEAGHATPDTSVDSELDFASPPRGATLAVATKKRKKSKRRKTPQHMTALQQLRSQPQFDAYLRRRMRQLVDSGCAPGAALLL